MQHRVETVIDGADLDHGRNRRHDKPQNPQALLAEPVRGAGGEGQAVLVAVGQKDWHDKVVPIPGRFQVGDDAEAAVGCLREVEEQPFPGVVNVGKRALAVEPIVLGAMR